VRHLQQQQLHMKNSLTGYIDQKIVAQEEHYITFDQKIAALQEQLAAKQQLS
jgi:hypothetical protein